MKSILDYVNTAHNYIIHELKLLKIIVSFIDTLTDLVQNCS
jgi:hypothetical protein